MIRAVVACFWPQLLLIQVIKIASHLGVVSSAMLLGVVLVFQEELNKDGRQHISDREFATGLAAISGLVMLGIAQIFLDSHLSSTFSESAFGSILDSAALFFSVV